MSSIWAVALLALGFRAVLSWQTPVPAEDGANYLWMAERFAAGDFVLPIGEVFPPLGPMLTALPIALGVPAVAAMQGVMALAGALSVVTIGRAVRLGLATRLENGSADAGRRAGFAAGWLMCWSPLAARFGAECYSEPLFLCVIGVALEAGIRRRPWRCGFWSAVGFWVRPEALIVPVAFALAGAAQRRRPGAARGSAGSRAGWYALVPLGLGVGLLTLWRSVATGDFHPLPKLAFNVARGLEESGQWWANLGRVPLAAIEAYGPMLLLGIWGWWRREQLPAAARHTARDCVWVWALALVPIVTFAVRRRFFVSWTGVVAVGCALGVLCMGGRTRRVAALLWVVYGVAVGWRGLIDPTRVAERDLGRWLAAQMAPRERVEGDMTRVLYFAGQRPLPPTHFEASELVVRASADGVAYAVFSTARATWNDVQERLVDWRPVALPQELAEAAAARRLTVLAAPGVGAAAGDEPR